MLDDLAADFPFSTRQTGPLRRATALDGRVQFILHENPDRAILHTRQVERNGFIHALLCGTPEEEEGYQYFGPPAYEALIDD